MKSSIVGLFLAVLLSVGLGACKHQQVLKSTDVESKYKTAMALYDSKDYYRALQIFDQLVPIFKGNAKNEEILFKYANCYLHQEDYILAAYYFKRFVATFPYSEYAEEAAYYSAYCHYLNSPYYSLDQTDTYTALNELQAFVKLYPKSERMGDINKMVDELRGKLERKAYEIVKLYYRMDKYNASVTSINTFLDEFPDTKHLEEIMVMKMNSLYNLALHSIFEKQEERLQMVVNEYKDFIETYPNSKYTKEITSTYKKAIEMLATI